MQPKGMSSAAYQNQNSLASAEMTFFWVFLLNTITAELTI